MNYAAFFSGVFMATFAASGLFFLKFWRASRDRFFLYFCIACFLLAAERLILLFVGVHGPQSNLINIEKSWLYLIRLFAFIMISWAVIDKNRSAGRKW
jgi:hypothetical protein